MDRNMSPLHVIELTAWDELPSMIPPKPMNTRTRKTAWKERRRLANAPKSIQKRVLKRK
jgi:hypothetical protein